MKSVLLFFGLALQLFIINPAEACTAFCLCSDPQNIVVGKSYDWVVNHDHGAVFTNARGCQRSALILDQSPNPAKWVSKYGSVTFTQFGRGFPIGGMNEKGLVIEMLQLDETEYDSAEVSRPYVNEAQWTQYQLDNYATVAEVIENLNKIRVVEAYTGIHYFLTDATGNSAAIQYLNGKAVVINGSNMPWPLLTNDIYESSVRYVKDHSGRDDTTTIFNRGSEDRFQNVTIMMKDKNSQAWDILDSVRVSFNIKPTQWNALYNASTGEVSWRMNHDNKIKTFNMRNLDFSDKRGLALDMNVKASGNVEALFTAFDPAFNAKLINDNSLIVGAKKRNAAIAHDKMECR